MSALNIMCGICSEFYKSDDTVYSTTVCGHLFHDRCLFRWLGRAQNCPQCRRICHRNRVHRVYLNFGERTEADDLLDEVADNTPNWILLDEPTNPNEPEKVHPGAIKAGTDPDGNDVYVARVYFQDDLLPANYVPQKCGAYVSWSVRAHFLRKELEILLDTGNYKWVAASNGQVPPDAISTGFSELGENLYTGRAMYKGITLPGKVHPSHRCLYMPYNGQEVNVKEYEVLVLMPKDKQQDQKV